jgi:hypothetical protein
MLSLLLAAGSSPALSAVAVAAAMMAEVRWRTRVVGGWLAV